MSAPGLVAWLAAMGVRHFTSLVPSDLEYDPNVRAVVEWRDAPGLMDYRLDNAITDALLEQADLGARLGYPWYGLPAGRLLKAFSVGQSWVGAAPLVPGCAIGEDADPAQPWSTRDRSVLGRGAGEPDGPTIDPLPAGSHTVTVRFLNPTDPPERSLVVEQSGDPRRMRGGDDVT